MQILSAKKDIERYKIVNSIDNRPSQATQWQALMTERYPCPSRWSEFELKTDRLSPEMRAEIAESPLKNAELARKYQTTTSTIRRIKAAT